MPEKVVSTGASCPLVDVQSKSRACLTTLSRGACSRVRKTKHIRQTHRHCPNYFIYDMMRSGTRAASGVHVKLCHNSEARSQITATTLSQVTATSVSHGRGCRSSSARAIPISRRHVRNKSSRGRFAQGRLRARQPRRVVGIVAERDAISAFRRAISRTRQVHACKHCTVTVCIACSTYTFRYTVCMYVCTHVCTPYGVANSSNLGTALRDSLPASGGCSVEQTRVPCLACQKSERLQGRRFAQGSTPLSGVSRPPARLVWHEPIVMSSLH